MMTRIAPVRLMYNPKVLWFDAKDFKIPVEAPVVVLTARGTEYGRLADPIFDATDEEVANLKTELKPVLRLGTEADAEAAEEAQALSIAAMPVFRELAAEESAEMRPIAVEYLLTCDKAIFYFEAENRIDFRELVRKLANRLHVRVDMRQIGSRDEARMMGGLGHCGQELCCKRLGGEFAPVSIRMAKEQDLSLNPQKISGLCGKLMCCLRYEYEAYKDFHARAPKVGEFVNTPDGRAKVVELDVPREILTLLMPDDKKVKFALADMLPPAEEGAKPTEVDPAAWEETMSTVSAGGVFEAAYLINKFTAESQLGSAKAVRRGGSAAASSGSASAASGAASGKAAKAAKGAAEPASGAEGAKKAARKKKSAEQGKPAEKPAEKAASAAASGTVVRRRRRGEARSMDTGTAAVPAAAETKKTAGQAQVSASGNRPGQKSSGLRREQGTAAKDIVKDSAKASKPKADAAEKQQKASQGKGKAQAQGKGQAASQAKAAPKQDAKPKQAKPKDGAKAEAKPKDTAKAQAPAKAKDAAQASAAESAPKRREPRRRVRVDTSE